MFLHPYLQKQIDLDIEKHAEPKNMATSSQKGTATIYMWMDIYSMWPMECEPAGDINNR